LDQSSNVCRECHAPCTLNPMRDFPYYNFTVTQKMCPLRHQVCAGQPCLCAPCEPSPVSRRVYKTNQEFIITLFLTKAARSNGYYDTIRKNSKTTAYLWRKSINLRVVKSFDKNCGSVYRILGFKPFNNYRTLQNISTSATLSYRSVFILSGYASFNRKPVRRSAFNESQLLFDIAPNFFWLFMK
jgi:hypothetical protein